MNIRPIESTLEDLGNVSRKIVATEPQVVVEYQISCLNNGNINYNALYVGCNKLSTLNFEFTFTSKKLSDRSKKRVIRNLNVERVRFIIEKKAKPIQVEIPAHKYKEFMEFMSGKGRQDKVVVVDRMEKQPVRSEHTALLEQTKQMPKNFTNPPSRVVHDQDGEVIDTKSVWNYDGSLCMSVQKENLIIKSAGKRGVEFLQKMKIPRYGLEYFGEGRPFTRVK